MPEGMLRRKKEVIQVSAGSELASVRAGTEDVGEITRRVAAEKAASDSVRIGCDRSFLRATGSPTDA